MSLYSSIEKTFFNSLTKKIVGNVVFLLGPNLIVAAIGYWVYQDLNSLHAQLDTSQAAGAVLEQSASTLSVASLVLLIYTFLIGTFTIFFMRHLFLRPIGSITNVLRAVKERDGDISATLPQYSHDEISSMAESYNDFSHSLKKMR